MRKHRVRTKHPRYLIPYYERGRGRVFGLVPPERVELPLDDSLKANQVIVEFEEDWDKAGAYDRQLMLQAMKQGAIQSQRLLDSRTIDDSNKQMEVYKTQQIYLNAYQAYSNRIDVVQE